MTNNAAERELHAVAGGLRNWTFAGINEGGDRGAAIYTLIQTAKLNDIDPHAWLTARQSRRTCGLHRKRTQQRSLSLACFLRAS